MERHVIPSVVNSVYTAAPAESFARLTFSSCLRTSRINHFFLDLILRIQNIHNHSLPYVLFFLNPESELRINAVKN